MAASFGRHFVFRSLSHSLPAQDLAAAEAAKATAAAAAGAGKFEEAVTAYGLALEACPSAALYAKRGDIFLHMQRPNAAIADADAALKLNADSAKAHAVRGKAHRLLGAWEKAAADLGTAQSIDFDSHVEGVLKVVLAKAHIVASRRAAHKAEA